MNEQKSNYIEYLSILVKWRKFILKTFFIVCFLTAVYSLIIPKTFTATATIIPSSQDGGAFGLSALLGDIPFSNLIPGGFGQEVSTYLAILNSRTLMETVASRFNLQERYNAENMEATVKSLRERVGINVNEDGTISISADATTKTFLTSEEDETEARQVATDMANFFVSELDKRNINLKTEKAKNNRTFIENRYFQNLEDLKNAELALNTFQKEYGAIDLPTQLREGIAAAAQVKAEIIAKEIEVGSLEKIFSKFHNSYELALTELNELEKIYREFRYRKNNGTAFRDEEKDIFIPFEDIPDLGLQYARLFREIVIQEKLMEFILPQYEQAKILEAKEAPTLQVLDEAVPPVLRTSPKRTLMVLFWGALSVFICMLVIFTIESFERMKVTSPQQYEKIRGLYEQVRGDLRFFRKKNA